MKYIRLFIFATLLIVPFHTVLAETISAIQVEGNTRINTQVLKSALGLAVGDDYSPEDIQKGIKNLYSIGLFSHIDIYREETSDGIELTVRVKERPVLDSVKISGNKKVKEKKLTEKITLRVGQPYVPAKEATTIHQMKEVYREKGYFLVDITAKKDTLDNNNITLEFDIDEGKKVTVKKITFSGNEQIGDSELRKKSDLETKEDRWYRSGDFKQEEFDEDLDRIVQYYQKHGYIDAQVLGYTIDYDSLKTFMFIDIQVEEGTQYHVGLINWDGNKLFTRKQLDRTLKYDEGEIYNQEKMDKTLEELYTIYTEEGYIYANIIPDRYTEGNRVDITYRIVENDPAHVHKIDIAGNYRTKEKVIRRELAIRPGDMFKRSALIRSQRNIFNLGFFEDVQLQSNQANADGDIDLIFDVKEKSTGQISMGAGYSSQDALTGFLEVRQPNMFGRGQTVNVRWEFGKRRQNVELSVTEPWFMDTPTTAGIDLFHTNQNRIGDYYEIRRTGGALRLGRPIPGFDYGRAYWQYRLEQRDLKIDDDKRDLFSSYFRNQEGERLQSSMIFTIVRDSRDNIFHPTLGSRTSFRAEFAGAYLGGEIDFQKYEVESSWYFTIFNPFVLMIKSETGVIAGYSEDSTVPLDERFYPGGTSFDGLVRGYKDRSLSPVENGEYIGGRSKLLFNIENQFKMVEQIYGLMFFDAGNSWNSIIEARPTDLKRSVGLGIRIETPVGPIGFDYGYGFDKDNPGWEPHFQFGTMF